MKVYVLSGIVKHEMSYAIGVYDNLEKAENKKTNLINDGSTYDFFDIEEFELE